MRTHEIASQTMAVQNEMPTTVRPSEYFKLERNEVVAIGKTKKKENLVRKREKIGVTFDLIWWCLDL